MSKVKKPKTQYQGKEDDFQISIASYLDAKKVLWCHVTNEGMIPVYYRAKLKRKGLKNGVPDILIFHPNNTYNGLAIELKAQYNKPSESQLFWIEELKKHKWNAVWSNNIDEVLKLIDDYLGNK